MAISTTTLEGTQTPNITATNNTTNQSESKSLPDLCRKRDLWLKGSKDWNLIYITLGVLSVTLSALAAFNFTGKAAPYLSGLTALIIATIGFLNPEKRRIKCIRAYLILDTAILRFQDKLIDIRKLYDEHERAENLLHSEELMNRNRE